MSTRAAIARVTGDTFRGVYHHWDGYPEGLGATLYELNRDHFHGDTAKMLRLLIDRHPAGWSTINGADFTLKPGAIERDEYSCVTCGRPAWEHYYQNYASHNATPPAGWNTNLQGYVVLGHSPIQADQPKRPECSCHDVNGKRNKQKAWKITEQDAAGSGVEYVYAFDEERHHMFVLSSYCADGAKMIGMFGMGDPDSTWKVVADIDLNASAPAWDKVAA